MNQNEIEARLWDAADELRAEMHRSALNLSYDEQPMPDINPDNLDVRVASGLRPGCLPGCTNGTRTARKT